MDFGIFHIYYRLDIGAYVMACVYICRADFAYHTFGVQFRLGKRQKKLLYSFHPCGKYFCYGLSYTFALEPMAAFTFDYSGGAYSVSCFQGEKTASISRSTVGRVRKSGLYFLLLKSIPLFCCIF